MIMTKEDAVFFLENPYAAYSFTNGLERLEEAKKMALDALKLTIPKSLVLRSNGYDQDGQMIIDSCCPACGHVLDVGSLDICPNCGQWIKCDQ